jgi:hypothetical protein
MNSDLSLTLVASLFFLILSSRYAHNMMKKVGKISDDMSTVGRTVIFALLFTLSLRIL